MPTTAVSSSSCFSSSSKTRTLGICVAAAILLLHINGNGPMQLQLQPQKECSPTPAIQQDKALLIPLQSVQATAVVTAAPLRYQEREPLVRAPRRTVALIGPHDRFNFGDLLFEKIVRQLLIDRAGYLDAEIVAVGMVNVDMSQYGGNPQVWSANRAIHVSREAVRTMNNADGVTYSKGTAAADNHNHNHHQGPFDVVYLGGESLGCEFSCGRRMLATEALRQQADAEKVSEECAYLFPKHLLVPPELLHAKNQTMPVSIVNSVGRRAAQFPCRPAVETADFISFRDLKQGDSHRTFPIAQARPDCAVLTGVLFNDTAIAQYATSGEVESVMQQTQPNGGYLAVQLKSAIAHEAAIPTIAKGLDAVWEHTNLTTVFFRAGSVLGHDSLYTYRDIIKAMKGPALLFEPEHVWSVVALIARASAVVSTSLHVRIMAFAHQRPRVTICNPGGKHHNFITLWEASDATACVRHKDAQQTDPSAIWKAVHQSMGTPIQQTEQAIETATKSYLEGFDEWSGLLN